MDKPEQDITTNSEVIMSIIIPTPEQVNSSTPGITITVPSSITNYI